MRHTVATSLSEHTIMNWPSSGAPHDDAFTAANAGNVSARRMWRGKWRCQSCTGFRKDTHRHSNHRFSTSPDLSTAKENASIREIPGGVTSLSSKFGQKGGARCRKPVITVPFDADFSMIIRLSASTHAVTCNRTKRERHPPTPKGSGQLETLAMRRRASTARGASCIFWSRMLFLSCKPIIDN